MSFASRRHIHDVIACPEVSKRFRALGFQDHPTGTEIDSQALREALRGNMDDTSLQFRYRPDKLFIHPIIGSLICEIKSESTGHKNFAIEFVSYAVGMIWAKSHRLVYSFVEIANGCPFRLRCCWGEEIPHPTKVFVPQRWDATEMEYYLLKRYPDIDIIRKSHDSGSGTPYFLVPKTAQYLTGFSEFMEAILQPGLQEPEAVQAVLF